MSGPDKAAALPRAAGAMLLEIALAMTLIALAAAVSYPRAQEQRLAHERRHDLDDAQRLLLWSRRSAISSGSCKELCLGGDGGSDCLPGPAAEIQLRDCGSGRMLLRIHLQQSRAQWKGFRSGEPAGFDARGNPLAVSGSLYLCSADAANALLGGYTVNRTGRIRPRIPEADSACPFS